MKVLPIFIYVILALVPPLLTSPIKEVQSVNSQIMRGQSTQYPQYVPQVQDTQKERNQQNHQKNIYHPKEQVVPQQMGKVQFPTKKYKTKRQTNLDINPELIDKIFQIPLGILQSVKELVKIAPKPTGSQ